MSFLYFAYGSNMSRKRLAERIPDVRSRGAAWMEDRRLSFNKPGRDGTGKANLIEHSGSHAWGVVYELDGDDWDVLDRFESGYSRLIVEVRSGWNAAGVRRRRDASRFDVQTYLWSGEEAVGEEGGDALIPPASWYLDHLRAGAREHGLPAHYLRVIESVAAAADSRV
jgi:gamma-glutamylcyclotransferase